MHRLQLGLQSHWFELNVTLLCRIDILFNILQVANKLIVSSNLTVSNSDVGNQSMIQNCGYASLIYVKFEFHVFMRLLDAN